MSNFINKKNPGDFGYKDVSYKAAGEIEGLTNLTRDFYEIMSLQPSAEKIFTMHSEDVSVVTDKLTLFLSMWLGGPKTYKEKYNFVGIPNAHKHLVINESEKEAWLKCMDQAVDKQNFSSNFKLYLKEQFRFPAELIRKTSLFE